MHELKQKKIRALDGEVGIKSHDRLRSHWHLILVEGEGPLVGHTTYAGAGPIPKTNWQHTGLHGIEGTKLKAGGMERSVGKGG